MRRRGDSRAVVVNPAPDALSAPSALLPGPRAEGAATDGEIPRHLSNSGVDIILGRQVSDPGSNFEPPACPRCEAPIDAEPYIDHVGDWVSTGEPTVTCSACGHAALLGDWPGRTACHLAEIGVRCNNWPPLRDAFERELGQLLGPRARVIFAHY